MFIQDSPHSARRRVLIQWMVMIFCSGIMNVVAFIGLGTFATHVTGFATLFGVHAANLSFGNAAAALLVPLFFLLGSMISGFLIEGRVRSNRSPHYDTVMFLCCLAMVATALLSHSSSLDEVQTHLHIRKNLLLLSLVTLTSGLLNASLSYSSQATIRVTHLTGATTDLGRGIAELISLFRSKDPKFTTELRLNKLRVATILSFIVGSLLGAILFLKVDFYVLWIPAAYFAYAFLHGRKARILRELAHPQKSPAN